MLSIISLAVALVTAILTYLLKEPEFLKEFEDSNQHFRLLPNNQKSFNLGVKLHLVSSIRRFYHELNKIKPIFIFLLIGIVGTGLFLALWNFSITNGVDKKIIEVYSVLVLLFAGISFMVSLYAYLFSFIVGK